MQTHVHRIKEEEGYAGSEADDASNFSNDLLTRTRTCLRSPMCVKGMCLGHHQRERERESKGEGKEGKGVGTYRELGEEGTAVAVLHAQPEGGAAGRTRRHCSDRCRCCRGAEDGEEGGGGGGGGDEEGSCGGDGGDDCQEELEGVDRAPHVAAVLVPYGPWSWPRT